MLTGFRFDRGCVRRARKQAGRAGGDGAADNGAIRRRLGMATPRV